MSDEGATTSRIRRGSKILSDMMPLVPPRLTRGSATILGVLLLLLMLLASQIYIKPLEAQDDGLETSIQYDVATRWTTVIGDTAVGLHLFMAVTEPDDSRGAYTAQYYSIVYTHSQNSLDWFPTNDIIYDARPIEGMSVVFTPERAHIFWTSDCIRHSYAERSAPMGDGRSWSQPNCVAERAVQDGMSAATDNEGNIYLVYSTGSSLLFQSSSDDGTIWTSPEIIATARGPVGAEYIGFPRIAADSSRVAAVWSTGSESEISTGVFVALTDMQRVSWTAPVELAQQGNGQPNVAVRGDEIHVIWNTRVGISERQHRWSSDGGNTWSSTTTLLSGVQGGYVGAPALSISQDNTVRVLLGTDEGVRHRSLDPLRRGWSPATTLGSEGDGETWFTGLSSLEGNEYCAYWSIRPGGFRIYCTAQPTVVQPVPTNTVATSPTSPPNEELTASDEESTADDTDSAQQPTQLDQFPETVQVGYSTGRPLTISAIATALVLGILVLFRRTRK